MNRTTLITLSAVLLMACAGEQPPPPERTDTTPAPTGPITLPQPTVDTGWPVGDLGSVMIVRRKDEKKVGIYGLFVDDTNFDNAAYCAIERSVPCLATVPPDEDTYLDFDPDRDFDGDISDTRFLGLEMTIAGELLAYQADDGVGGYTTKIKDYPQGWVGVGWDGGMWGTREPGEDLFISPPIELISPVADSHIPLHDGRMMPIEWVPTGEGPVYLTITEGFGRVARIYTLADDGYYLFDIDELGLGTDDETLRFSLSRWNQSQIHYHGHTVDVIAITDERFVVDYFYVGSRDLLEPANQCGQAEGMLPITAGSYWGRLGTLSNNLSNDCVGGGNGEDGILKLTLDPKERMNLEFNMRDQSASVYVVENCRFSSSCLIGSDVSAYEDIPENLQWFNATDEPETTYIVLDGTDNSSLFTLDVNIEPLDEAPMGDSCTDQGNITKLTASAYFSELTSFANDLNPGVGGCTSSSLPGADAMGTLEVGPGETVSVTVIMPEGDPAIYFLAGNCNDPFSCLVGADTNLGDEENLEYINTTAGVQTLYLVVDSKVSLAPYFLTIAIN